MRQTDGEEAGQGMASEAEYRFKPHERPLVPGSPATPDHPTKRRVLYFLIGLLVGLTGGFGNAILTVNLQQIQGALGLSQEEAGWLTAAYSMTNVCMSMLLIKLRQRFGLQRFTRAILFGFVGLSVVQLFFRSFALEFVVRAGSGIVCSGLTALAMYYMMQSLPSKYRFGGIVCGIGMTQLALPLTRVFSPALLVDGDIQNLFLLELGLGLATLGATWLLRLPPSITVDKAFEGLDFITLCFLIPGMALLTGVLVQGRIVWWSTPWIGAALAASLVLIGFAVLIERNRANPMLNIRWMTSREVLSFGIVAASMRILLSEQSYGTTGLMMILGMGNEQLVMLYICVSLAMIAGMVVSVFTLDPHDVIKPVLISLALIIVASTIDSFSSNITRPQQFYLTQAMIGFASIFFFGPTMMSGMYRALSRGPAHIVSYSAMFSIAQTLGGLGGSALLGTYQIVRRQFHFNHIVQTMVLSDPQVAQRLNQLAASYGRYIADPVRDQLQGLTALQQVVLREANVLAYNDVFRLVAVISAIAFVALGMQWVYYRVNRIDPLAEHLASVQRQRQGLDKSG